MCVCIDPASFVPTAPSWLADTLPSYEELVGIPQRGGAPRPLRPGGDRWVNLHYNNPIHMFLLSKISLGFCH